MASNEISTVLTLELYYWLVLLNTTSVKMEYDIAFHICNSLHYSERMLL